MAYSQAISKAEYSFIAVDHLQNIYALVTSDTLRKFPDHKNTQKEYFYSNTTLGKITSFDVSNPMRPIVCHGEFSTLVMLDVTLQETNRFYLPQFGIYAQPPAYAMNNDNSIWLYNDVSTEIIRMNQNQKLELNSPPLLQELGFVPQIASMQFRTNTLVLLDPSRGFIVCDQFGTFVSFIPAQNVIDYQLINDAIIYHSKDKIYWQSVSGVGFKEIYQLKDKERQAVLQGNQLIILQDNQIIRQSIED